MLPMKKFIISKDAIEHFKNNDPILYKLIVDLPEPDRYINDNLFQELVRSIIAQQVSTKAAKTIYQRIVDKFEIKPENFLECDKDDLQSIGISYRKVEYLKNLSSQVHSKELNLETITSLSNEEIIQEITKVKGLGIWSAEVFLMFALGRNDITSFGDLMIKRGIAKVYQLNDLPTKEKFQELTKKWSPYNTIAHFYIWEASKL